MRRERQRNNQPPYCRAEPELKVCFTCILFMPFASRSTSSLSVSHGTPAHDLPSLKFSVRLLKIRELIPFIPAILIPIVVWLRSALAILRSEVWLALKCGPEVSLLRRFGRLLTGWEARLLGDRPLIIPAEVSTNTPGGGIAIVPEA